MLWDRCLERVQRFSGKRFLSTGAQQDKSPGWARGPARAFSAPSSTTPDGGWPHDVTYSSSRMMVVVVGAIVGKILRISPAKFSDVRPGALAIASIAH